MNYKFYTVIIGTELLNGRRSDAHFPFINRELIERGLEHAGSFLIVDNPSLMEDIFRLIASEPENVIFCFGGIGATPDDYTREVAAKALRDGHMEYQKEAEEIILKRFGDRAYPNRIQMSHLPEGSAIIPNPVNQIPGFSVDEKYFFVPGFPEMAHPMLQWVLDRYFPKQEKKHRKTFFIQTSEESLIAFMKGLPTEIELSSLPEITPNGPGVTLSLSSKDATILAQYFGELENLIQQQSWEHQLIDNE